ncbi:hypothetical protein CCY99_00520 [Helicobacter sp. 16-1353]|uniref:glycosyl transferase family 90 n=1 Tax=Helicobacter sp. 16-1353 TaxID=2004996 RepID=UPI000DCEBE7F|nr:glycosyl transferase family 90 [Helicobacter sp. 16-1353]RAX55216.1 hypothetical protein CCY99_00520 [Helicobacter sp. 16-1353]
MKNNRFFYHIKGLWRYFWDRFLRVLLPSLHKYFYLDSRDKLLENAKNRADYGYIIDRVNYYNRLTSLDSANLDFKDSKDSTNLDSKKSKDSAPKSPKSTPIKIINFTLPKKGLNYFFDTHEFIRYFEDNLSFILEGGDVNYAISKPSICKSRPIVPINGNLESQAKNANNILLNLDKIRHFLFINDPYKFEDKDNLLYFRGGVYQRHRVEFFKKYFSDKRCDIGHTGSVSAENRAFVKPKASIKTHLSHKFILSLEGNDVASNLKWIMSSNSLAVAPKPKFETWFMEGKLKGDFHYIEIDENYENVFDKLEFYAKNTDLANKIRLNANAYCKQFFDKNREQIIALLVLEKYFKNARFNKF